MNRKKHSTYSWKHCQFYEGIHNVKYSSWSIKKSQLVFVCNFVKNQLIFIGFSLLDLGMNNDTCRGMTLIHLAYKSKLAPFLWTTSVQYTKRSSTDQRADNKIKHRLCKKIRIYPNLILISFTFKANLF